MYQFYYAKNEEYVRGKCNDNISKHFNITAIRPSMWEEHCLECSAPLCFQNCVHYEARSDGRCKRFSNGLLTFEDSRACCGQGAHVTFRKWANMMTIIFPSMMTEEEYQKLYEKNEKLGARLKKVADSKLPRKARWELIRTEEYLRRRKLRHMTTDNIVPDAFVFHGYSYTKQDYNLILEIYNEHTPVYKTALQIKPGENLTIIKKERLSEECWKTNNLVKIYPENDIEAELDILWCDFVQGKSIDTEVPAPKVKCLVWDLDNTLWDGTLIEVDDTGDLCLKDGVLETIHALDERGIIQSIASKNDYNEAWLIIEQLGLAEYFLYPQIHWNAKSGSIEQIASKLNIGIDTLALIDDSVFERKQVQSIWPQVRVYDANELGELLSKPEFSVMVTDESKRRRSMYQAEEKRNELMAEGNGGTIEFLKKCHLTINIFSPETEAQIMRCYELVVRTNQLNMSGHKYTQAEFSEVIKRNDRKSFAFSCRDDFGEYGIVGFGQYQVEEGILEFKEFAMSCRVAGKYVESALFSGLLEKEKCNRGTFDVQKTKKNALLRRTLSDIGFVIESESEKDIDYSFSLQLKNKDLVKEKIEEDF